MSVSWTTSLLPTLAFTTDEGAEVDVFIFDDDVVVVSWTGGVLLRAGS
jgi:hypothetical protein